ncbi:MAG: hypothetical protein V4713_17750 [Pseudomonadota bacterium]
MFFQLGWHESGTPHLPCAVADFSSIQDEKMPDPLAKIGPTGWAGINVLWPPYENVIALHP